MKGARDESKKFLLCEPGCFGIVTDGLHAIPIEDLVEDCHSADPQAAKKSTDNFKEGKLVQESRSRACFAPSQNASANGLRLTFRRVGIVMNKSEFIEEMETNPTIRTTRYLKTIMAPVEGSKTSEREKTYVFQFHYTLMHRRWVILGEYTDEVSEDLLMTTNSQFFAGQAQLIQQHMKNKRLRETGAHCLFASDLPTIGEVYQKLTGKPYENPPAPLGPAGTSEHYEASNMLDQADPTTPKAASAEPTEDFALNADEDGEGAAVAVRRLSSSFDLAMPAPKLRRTGSANLSSGSARAASPHTDDICDTASVCSLDELGNDKNTGKSVLQRYTEKLDAFGSLQHQNRGVFRWHAGEYYKKLVNQNNPMARALKKIMDLYDKTAEVVGSKGELLEFSDFIEKLADLHRQLGKLPGNMEWQAMTRTLVHLRSSTHDLASFTVFLKRGFPVQSQKLGTLGASIDFDATTVMLSTVAAAWDAKAAVFNDSVVDEFTVPHLSERSKHAFLCQCMDFLVEVVEDCLTHTEGLGAREIAFLTSTASWARTVHLSLDLENTLERSDAVTYIDDLATVCAKKRPVGTTLDAVATALEDSPVFDAIRPHL